MQPQTALRESRSGAGARLPRAVLRPVWAALATSALQQQAVVCMNRESDKLVLTFVKANKLR